MATCSVAPTSTTRPTSISSASRKRIPMLNMSSATPMSARPWTSSRSAMYPGVNGPIRRPAAM
jgi:hypothetical protein